MPHHKPFGVWTLTFLVIANMIGAGVFTTSGFTLQELGSPRLVMAAWVVGGLIALAGAVSYGQLIRAIPESGGEYVFLSRAAHPLFGFVAGWVSFLAGFSGAIAFAATALESYVLPEESRPAWLPADTLAVTVVIVAGIFHGLRPRLGAFVQNTTVLLKVALLLGFLGLAAWRLPSLTWYDEPLIATSSWNWKLTAAFASSLVWISLSYSGFNAAVYIAGEAEDATQSVPKALLRGSLIVFVLYVALNAVFVFGPPPQEIAGRPDVAAIAASSIGGSHFATFVRLIIAMALLTSVSSMMMAAPRVYAKMAEDGLLPRLLRMQGDSPRWAVGLQAIFAAVLILASDLQGLLSYLGLTLSLSAAFSVGCLFLPSVRRKPIIHISHIPPVVYIVCTVSAAVFMTAREPIQILATAVTFSVGAVVYVVYIWSTNSTHRQGPRHGAAQE